MAKCAVCESGVESFWSKIEEDINGMGWSIVCVADAPIPFAYTVGLTNYNHPELVMSGLPYQTMGVILNSIGEKIKNGEKYSNDQTVTGFLGGGYELRFRKISTKKSWEYVAQAKNYFKPKRISALQVLWPDKNHVFPTEKGYKVTAEQMVLA